MSSCPCYSGKDFAACCEPYLTGAMFAPTPEALMRSRYTAYTLANINYIEKTQRDVAAKEFDRVESLQFAKESEWQGLEIVRSYQLAADVGYVEFIVHYNDGHHHHQHLHELSKFQHIEGQWYYVSGEQKSHDHAHYHEEKASPLRHDTPKLGRNDPCRCGSGKKYKKCCGV